MSEPGMIPDPWSALRKHTGARIALGRAGGSLPTAEVLKFALDHAEARDAVQTELDLDDLEKQLAGLQIPSVRVETLVKNRATYLRRPELGRRLDDVSREKLQGAIVGSALADACPGTAACDDPSIRQYCVSASWTLRVTRLAASLARRWERNGSTQGNPRSKRPASEAAKQISPTPSALGAQSCNAETSGTHSTASASYDIALIIADGLCARAAQTYAAPLLAVLIPSLRDAGFGIAPLVLARYARVALQDDIAVALGAQAAIILLGERPGLHAPVSLGAYFVYEPRVGATDERRNCVSNIRGGGLAPAAAAETLSYLVREAFRRRTSGVNLKDERKTGQFGSRAFSESV